MVLDLAGFARYAQFDSTLNRVSYRPWLQTLTELNAQYLSRIAFKWDWEQDMVMDTSYFGNSYYAGVRRVVNDINYSYDTANLRRPIIEAAVLESITPNVNNVPVPQYIRDYFLNEKNPFHSEYRSSGYSSSEPQFFEYSSIRGKNKDRSDVTRIQTKMWFYYLATQYIDLGYQAIHFGDINAYASQDAPTYRHTYRLFSLIRQYAKNKGTFVLLNADVEKDVYFENDGYTLLLDFNSSPIRPEEPRSLRGYNILPSNNIPCGDDSNVTTELTFQNNAHLLNSKGGLSPQGCRYDKTPVLFNLDWSACNGPFNEPNFGGWQPYGVDEMSWFNSLSKACQAYWIKNAACAIKNDIVYRGYFKMPGIEGAGCKIDGVAPPEGIRYDLLDPMDVNNEVKTAISSVWNLINAATNFTLKEDCECRQIKKVNCRKGIRTYTLNVTNPDCSSIYSWSIKNKQTGEWLPVTYGREARFLGLTKGLYEIHLQQSNLGFACNRDRIEIVKEWLIKDERCNNQ